MPRGMRWEMGGDGGFGRGVSSLISPTLRYGLFDDAAKGGGKGVNLKEYQRASLRFSAHVGEPWVTEEGIGPSVAGVCV